jgi:hypothetical protein
MAKTVKKVHHHAPAHVPDAHKNVADKPQGPEDIKPYEKGFKPVTALEARINKTVETLRLNNLLTPTGIAQAKTDVLQAVISKQVACDLIGKALEDLITALINAAIKAQL